ncbi:hypothetical protein DMN91_004007 [Ooceraea biroi]|uniref:Elongation of very long chain fatty acids protein n=1 Tax=Ooceraea biroi TaxID=2015173 RepID=A0A3L8DV66_OOCBI|nr:elongation of very long chain fatty acids protein AAEL008004 [Ooceraea biroi]RLU23799.1 hypothetical protein DMN91_004007 [Ooceraea biroi]
MVYENEPGVLGESLQNSSHYILQETEFMDPRTIKWILISSPMPVTCIVLVYLYIIYLAGPKFMKNRQPYSLKMFIQCYNVLQVILNFWLVFNGVRRGNPFKAVWRYYDSFDTVFGHNAEELLGIVWWALMLKIFDFAETIMFVLRKKYQQVSGLHVYHHISTVLYVWIFLRYLIHGHIIFMLMLNCTVHVILYSYYFLSACGPKMQQRISPFKKWITIIQMVQLVFITLCGVPGLKIDCDKKGKYLGIITIFNGIANISFFWNFYRKTYKKSKTT